MIRKLLPPDFDAIIRGDITDANRDLDEETNLSRIKREIDHSVIEILRNLEEGYDDDTLHDYIVETIHLIRTSESFG